MCKGNTRLPNTVGRQICKKVVLLLIDPSGTAGAHILAFRRDFCDNSRTTEATSTCKTLQERFFDGTSFDFLKVYL